MNINVKHVAKLANLPLTSEEEEKYSEQLSKILEYVDQLDSVDTSNVEPTFNVSGSFNKTSTVSSVEPFRTDETSASLSQEEALSNVPKKENGLPAGQAGFFVTKGIFNEERG